MKKNLKINLAIIFGGQSVEHEVSVITALQAAAHISRDKYEIFYIYITKDSEFYTGEAAGVIENYRDIPALLKQLEPCAIIRHGGKVKLVRTDGKLFRRSVIALLDIALPAVHGAGAEDGSLAGYLQMSGLPYAGSDVLAGAVGMDKFVQKQILQNAGVPVLPAQRLRSAAYARGKSAALTELEQKIGFPIIIKPVNLGSSVGIKIARDGKQLQSALEHAYLFSDEIIAEHAVTNLREINCAVLGDADSAAPSECEEPLANGEILSYADKYAGGGGSKKAAAFAADGGGKGMASLQRKIPADISKEQRDFLRSTAVKAFHALGCSGVARLDFLVDGDDNDKIYFNEINTIPGSLAFYLFEPVGIPYADLLAEMLDLAFKRARGKASLNTSFNDINILQTANLGGKNRK